MTQVVFNGEAKYIAKSAHHRGQKFATEEELKKFAELAVSMLSARCPETCTEALLRVDIMYSNDNKMIVNEFESWDACIWGKSTDIKHELGVKKLLTEFWKTQLLKFIHID